MNIVLPYASKEPRKTANTCNIEYWQVDNTSIYHAYTTFYYFNKNTSLIEKGISD